MGQISDLGKRIYDMQNPREQRRYFVFLMRSLLHRKELKQLIQFFTADADRNKIFKCNAFPIEQVTRAFFYNKSNFAERVKLMREHYELLQDRLKPKEFVNWGDIDYRGYDIFERDFAEKHLRAFIKFGVGQRKEGLLSIIMELDNEPLYQIIFWLANDKDGNAAIWIGAMQGPNMENARDVVKKMTKACHGYRTKNLILYMLQAVARALAIKKIYAVSNYGYYANNHVRSDRKLKTNFGDFWQEAGGKETSDNRWFELPLAEARKTMEEVPTRKRAVYRRRFAFLDEVDSEIEKAITKVLKRSCVQNG